MITMIKEFWWLILGVAGVFAFIVRIGFDVYKLMQDKVTAEAAEYDREFWRRIGGVGLALYIFNTFFKNDYNS